MTDLTEGYVCASCDARPDSKCFRHGEKWLCGTCFDGARIAEKDADLAALRERLAAAEALSESRRVTLLAKSEELAAEWKRAETAEALVRELAEVVKAAKNTLHEYTIGGTHVRGCGACGIKAALAALSPAARKEIER